MFTRAGERAASLAASIQAQHAFERAIQLTDDRLVQADLHERAGLAAAIGARAEEASAHFERSLIFEAQSATHAAARVAAHHAEILWERGRLQDGLERMERSLALLLEEEPDEAVAVLAAQVARFRFFAGDTQIAYERIETALSLAEALALPEVLSQALNTKTMILETLGRPNEASVLIRHALEVALEHDKPWKAVRSDFNLAVANSVGDRYEEAADTVRQGLIYARRLGNRYWEWLFLGQAYPFYALGAWDEVLAMTDELPRDAWTQARIAVGSVLPSATAVLVYRGQLEEAKRMTNALAEIETSADVQERGLMAWPAHRSCSPRAIVRRHYESRRLRSRCEALGTEYETVKEAFALALAAATVGQLDKADELLALVERLPPGRRAAVSQRHRRSVPRDWQRRLDTPATLSGSSKAPAVSSTSLACRSTSRRPGSSMPSGSSPTAAARTRNRG